MKKALVLCASHNDIGMVIALKKLGYYVICTGSIPNQVGEPLCDKYICGDYSDKEFVLNLAQEYKVDAIVNSCNDWGVYSAAYASEKMGLPGYDSYETTLLLNNKDKFKDFAESIGIRTPIAKSFYEKETACKYVQQVKFPIIIKPTDASAGRGVQKVSEINYADSAIEAAFNVSKAKTIVIEPFIEGKQYGFCTFLVNKKVVGYCSNNEYSIINPYRVEMNTYPADNFDIVKDELTKQIELIANKLNLVDGIFHLQYIYDGEHAQILEVMRRLLGNRYFVAGNMLTGVDWEYWETRAKCGLSCKEFPATNQIGYVSSKVILAPRNGVIGSIDDSFYRPYVYDSIRVKNVGDTITDYQSQPVDILYLIFSTREQMEEVLVDSFRNDFVEMR